LLSRNFYSRPRGSSCAGGAPIARAGQRLHQRGSKRRWHDGQRGHAVVMWGMEVDATAPAGKRSRRCRPAAGCGPGRGKQRQGAGRVEAGCWLGGGDWRPGRGRVQVGPRQAEAGCRPVRVRLRAEPRRLEAGCGPSWKRMASCSAVHCSAAWPPSAASRRSTSGNPRAAGSRRRRWQPLHRRCCRPAADCRAGRE
jgi:hypothetical protein